MPAKKKKKKQLNKYKLRDQSLWVGIKRMSTNLCKVFNVILLKKKSIQITALDTLKLLLPG